MSNLKAGDKIIALPNTVSAIWAEGSVGIVAEVRDPKPYSGNDSNNLVRWQNGEGILLGFSVHDVELVD